MSLKIAQLCSAVYNFHRRIFSIPISTQYNFVHCCKSVGIAALNLHSEKLSSILPCAPCKSTTLEQCKSCGATLRSVTEKCGCPFSRCLDNRFSECLLHRLFCEPQNDPGHSVHTDQLYMHTAVVSSFHCH